MTEGADRVRERQLQTDRQTERGRGLRDFLFNATDRKTITTTIAAVVPASAVNQSINQSINQYKQEQHYNERPPPPQQPKQWSHLDLDLRQPVQPVLVGTRFRSRSVWVHHHQQQVSLHVIVIIIVVVVSLSSP